MPAGLPAVYLPFAAASGLANVLLVGAVPTVSLLLVGCLLGAAHRPLLRSLIIFSNTLLLAGALLLLLSAVSYGVVGLVYGDEYEQYALLNRLTGPYWAAYWGAVLCKGLLPQLLWLRRLRRSLGAGLVFAPLLLVDYWLPLLYAAHRDYLPASWAMLRPDWPALAGLSLAYLLLYALLFAVARWLGLAGGGE